MRYGRRSFNVALTACRAGPPTLLDHTLSQMIGGLARKLRDEGQ